MSVIGGYGTGSSASAIRYSTVDELLVQLPDNTANLIDASDIRDAVFSLWEFTTQTQTQASQSVSVVYTNPNPVPTTIGGISAGTTFPGTFSMQQMWDLLLYPYVAPVPSFVALSSRQYGAPTPVTLNWSVVRNSSAITSIIVEGSPQVPTGNSQTGTYATLGTHSTSPGISQVNYFTMSCSDGTTTPSASVTLTWMNKRYWGKVNLTSVGSPDLTLNPGSASIVGSFITSNTIKALSGAGVGSGSELATSKSKTYTGINGSGDYLIFSFPTSFGTPTFTVNGLPNSAFTKVKSNVALINEYNFSGTNYDTWVSNTAQGSPLNIVIS